MEIKHLLRSQSNEVFQALTGGGWNPSQFGWEDVSGPNSGNMVSRIVHIPSGYYFTFDNFSGFWSFWSPGEEKPTGVANSSNWKNQIGHFQTWLTYLKREIEAPDLWGAISREAQFIQATTSSDTTNTPFSPEEKTYVLSGLNEIKEYLLTAHKLDPELIESRLAYLMESSERLGRKDWLNLLLSVLVGIVIAAALPPEATRELFRFVGTVLRQILSRPLLLT